MGTDRQIAGYPRQLAPHLELRRVLGEGGSSVVFEAFHTRLKVPVAVKLLSVRGALAGQAGERLLREAKLYALLDDPRIPRVFDVDALADGTPYVVMEFVPGGSLDALLAHGPLSCRRAVRIAQEVLTALAYVHAQGVLHRDVKPANVILNEADGRCQIRLVDFGIAKAYFDSTPESGGPLTQQGTLVGTPHYMAPERLLGHEADARADIYAVGVMLYEMLAGSVPFGGPTLGEVIAAVLRDDAKPLHEHYPQVLPELERIVARAMERDLDVRYATAAEMLDALAELDVSLNGEVSSPRIIPPTRPSARPSARALSFPPLSLESEDARPRRRQLRSSPMPLLLLGAGAVAAWSMWPRDVIDLSSRRDPQSTTAAADPSSGTAAELTAARSTELPATAPTASVPTALESGLFPNAPLRRGDDTGRNLLLVDVEKAPQPEAYVDDALAEPEQIIPDPLDEAQVVSPERAEPSDRVSAPLAGPLVRFSRPAQPEADRADRVEDESGYAPVRAVPLQPLLDHIDTILKEPPPAEPAAPAPAPAHPDPLLPDNPY